MNKPAMLIKGYVLDVKGPGNSTLRAWAHNEGYCVTSDNARRRSEPRRRRDVAETKPRRS